MAFTLVTDGEVQQWLEDSKFPVASVDNQTELETSAKAVVFGELSNKWTTDTWVDPGSVPDMVRTIVSMLIAAYAYQAKVGQDDGEENYGTRLEARAMMLLAAVMSDTVEIGVEVDVEVQTAASASFFPTDASTSLYEDDPTNVGGTPRFFTMNAEF
jgi:hypothetical protein